MSECYVGPFGRILPSDGEPRPESPPTRLSRYRLPPPKKPTALMFGSDASLSYQENANKVKGQAPTAVDVAVADMQQKQDPLTVDQLLTPSPQTNFTTTSYPPSLDRSSSPSGASAQSISVNNQGYDLSTQHPPQAVHALSSRFGTFFNPEPIDASYGKYSGGQLPPLTQMPYDDATLMRREVNQLPLTRSSGAAVSCYHQSQLPQGSQLLNYETSLLPQQPTFQSGSPNSQKQGRLAQVLYEQFIEGEGMCYIYSDGSHCPKSIAGEPVNASWGITKAGKPRKRLAQACVTCRDKKIKCQPNIPKCDQCQKAGRECRFESATRGNQASTKTPTGNQSSSTKPMQSIELPPTSHAQHAPYSSYSTPGLFQTSAPSVASCSDASRFPSYSCDSWTALQEAKDNVPDFERPLKRPRRGSVDSYDTISGLFVSGNDKVLNIGEGSDLPSETQALEAQDPDSFEDPYHVNPELTQHYLDLYFQYINGATYCMFPYEPFMRWLKFYREKALEDKMLLYGLLAVGTMFSDKKERRCDGEKYLLMAEHAMTKTERAPTLQLAQTRIILSIWHSMNGSSAIAWDLTGSAIRGVCALGLPMEQEEHTSVGDQYRNHVLQAEALIECRRRTFWAAFLMDREETLLVNHPCFLKVQDIFLRLPCGQDSFEQEKGADMPFFQNVFSPDQHVLDERASLHPMAFLVEVSAIWGDVVEHIYRSAHIPSAQYCAKFEDFYDVTTRRADQWLATLPPHFIYSVVNMEQNVLAGQTDTFVAVHILYHATMMKLNRHARYHDLLDHIIYRNIRTARYHATEILRIAGSLSDILHTNHRKYRQTTFSTPLTGHAILSAIDIISAAGSMDDLPECIRLINGGLQIIEDLARFWHNARAQLQVIEPRVEGLVVIARKYIANMSNNNDNSDNGKGQLSFATKGRSLDAIILDKMMPMVDIGAGGSSSSVGCIGPAGTGFAASKRGDLVYSLPRNVYFEALGLDGISLQRGNVLWIRDSNDRG